jgi:hypothetical protein
MSNIKGANFKYTLSEKDWDSGTKSWKCDFLKLPGIKLSRLTDSAKAEEILSEMYVVDEKYHMIKWTRDGNTHPKEPIVWFEGKENLVTDRWKSVALILPFLTAVMGGVSPEAFKLVNKHKDYGSPAPSQASPTSSPSLPIDIPTPKGDPAKSPTSKNSYESKAYPLKSCGPDIRSKDMHPIFVSRKYSLNDVKEICRDAFPVRNEIQIASFNNEKDADLFLEFIRQKFKISWRGKP